MSSPVAGFCPQCGLDRLVVAEDRLRCTNPDCDRPTAAHEILQDHHVDHLVEITEHGFGMQHPLRERLDGALFACTLHQRMHGLDQAPQPPGFYMVGENAFTGELRWERIT